MEETLSYLPDASLSNSASTDPTLRTGYPARLFMLWRVEPKLSHYKTLAVDFTIPPHTRQDPGLASLTVIKEFLPPSVAPSFPIKIMVGGGYWKLQFPGRTLADGTNEEYGSCCSDYCDPGSKPVQSLQT